MLNISYAGFLVYLRPFRHNSLLNCVAVTKKITKPHYFWVQDRSMSSMLLPLKSSSSVLVMTSSTSAPICNHFHTRRANSDKIRTFKGYPSFTLSFKKNPLTQEHKISSQKTRVLGAAYSEDFMI